MQILKLLLINNGCNKTTGLKSDWNRIKQKLVIFILIVLILLIEKKDWKGQKNLFIFLINYNLYIYK